MDSRIAQRRSEVQAQRRADMLSQMQNLCDQLECVGERVLAAEDKAAIVEIVFSMRRAQFALSHPAITAEQACLLSEALNRCAVAIGSVTPEFNDKFEPITWNGSIEPINV